MAPMHEFPYVRQRFQSMELAFALRNEGKTPWDSRKPRAGKVKQIRQPAGPARGRCPGLEE